MQKLILLSSNNPAWATLGGSKLHCPFPLAWGPTTLCPPAQALPCSLSLPLFPAARLDFPFLLPLPPLSLKESEAGRDLINKKFASRRWMGWSVGERAPHHLVVIT